MARLAEEVIAGNHTTELPRDRPPLHDGRRRVRPVRRCGPVVQNFAVKE